MAERPKGYGMTAELQEKKDAKYDRELEEEVRAWMVKVTGEPLNAAGPQEFHEKLKDGVYLCKLINVIRPNSVPKINQSKMAFKMMENIGNFLAGCESIGVAKADIFQTVDLYEAQNMPQVVNGLQALGRKASKVNSAIPPFGPKEATENKRQFSEETLQAGKGVIGLQMGTNRGASQAGMTPTGLGRQIHDVNLKGVQ